MYVLGIDGGGSKTLGIITDRKGNVYAAAEAGATNPNSVLKDQVSEEISILLKKLKSQNLKAYVNLSGVFGGFAGTEHSSGKRTILAALRSELNNIPINIDSDALNALYSGTLGWPGVVQIAGTGSVAFGINYEGKRARVGGWGYLFDDEGSGYSIGRDVLSAVFKSFDGRSGETLLKQYLVLHYQTDNMQELLKKVYADEPRHIADLSKYAFEAAQSGDDIAKKILAKAAFQLANSIAVLIKKLFKEMDERIPVVLAGGLFQKADYFIPVIEEEAENNNLSIEIIVPDIPPAAGSVIAAWKEQGAILDSYFIENIKNGLAARLKS